MVSKIAKIKLKILKQRFYNEENSFAIYVAKVVDTYDEDDNPQLEYSYNNNISIKGTIGKLPDNEEYIAIIEHEKNDKYKGNYNVKNIYQELPKDFETQKLYFKALLTPNQYKSLIEVYDGCDLIELFKTNKIEYKKVHGLGEKRYSQVREKILSSMDLAEIITFSEKYSIPVETAKRYARDIGNPNLAVRKISENPYILTEMDGIGFVKADKIASKIGIVSDSKFRVKACLSRVLMESEGEGHTWVEKKELVDSMNLYLDINRNIIIKYIDEFVNDEKSDVLVSDNRYTRRSTLISEAVVAKNLKTLNDSSSNFVDPDRWEKMVDDYCAFHEYSLHEKQKKFLLEWNAKRINLLIGYGGSGKTFIQNVLIGILEENELYSDFALLAPTGRASKVIANYTNKTASTIHRRLKKGVDEAFIIVDESSMCDIFLSRKLLSIITNPKARILFVGDDFQIPSVGVGNFLYDIIHSGVINTIKLTEVFRQEDGGIKDITYKVRNNERFLLTGDEGRKQFGEDCVFWLVDSKFILNGLIKNYQNALKKYDEEDIMIVTPTNRGHFGTVNINNNIQKIVNPKSQGKNEIIQKRGDSEIVFREGDLVMNTVNTYDLIILNRDFTVASNSVDCVSASDSGESSLDVFNGDIGRIKRIDNDSKSIIIDFDGYEVKFEAENISQLLHGWCITIHKSQGSQAKAVILILDKSSTFQLNANLLYTGMSRASEILLVLGQEKTINSALRKFQNMERRSFLKEFLKGLKSDSEYKEYVSDYEINNLLSEVRALSGNVAPDEVKKEYKKNKKRLYY